MDKARERLTAAMDERRLELRLKWNAVARRADMDASNLRRIRKGEIPVTRDAAYGIERALEWPHGRVDMLLGRATADAEPAASADPYADPDDPPPFPLLDETEWEMWQIKEAAPEHRAARITRRRERIRQTGQ